MESMCTVGTVKWYGYYGNSMIVGQKIKVELSYDLMILLVGIYLKELKIRSKNTFAYPCS